MTTKIQKRYHANGEQKKTTPNPYICPQIMYCPEGTETAIMCPNGYWTVWRGSQSSTDCITCERGKWCNFKDLETDNSFISWLTWNPEWTLADILHPVNGIPAVVAAYYGDCSNGYICLEGATSSTPTDIATNRGYPCPIGHFCVAGETIETPCAPGTYNDQETRSSCFDCPAGYYCPDYGMSVPLICLEGYYCPGSNVYPTPCPTGTYGTSTGYDDVSQCT
jgi:hypothetical protein